MASQAVTTDEVLSTIETYIDSKQSFVLQGGAGSGKTYLLVRTIDLIFTHNPKTKVACVTFTKVAVNEIKERCTYDNLEVTTIHNFLWDAIKEYKNDLKSTLVELINAEDGIKYTGDKALNLDHFKDIDIHYEEWLKLEDGAISHDEVLKMASCMFSKFPMLGKIISDKFEYIVVDEYQDTEEQVIKLLLNNIPKGHMIGFFGDSMQSIYDKGVGSLDEYINAHSLKKLVRDGNRRCSRQVIDLINKVRDDGLQQVPSSDNLEGSVTFLYSMNPEISIENIRKHAVFKNWDFKDAENTKELYLTHNLISRQAGYDNLFKIYDKDQIISYVKSVKAELKKNPELAADVAGKTFGNVFDMSIKKPSKTVNEFIENNQALFEWARSLPFEQMRRMYVDKDQLVEGGSEKKENRGDKKDDLIKHLTKIQKCLYLYDTGQVHEFTLATDFKVQNVGDKSRLKDILDKFRVSSDMTIGEAIELADKEGLVRKDDNLTNFIHGSEYLYHQVKKVSYKEFVRLYDTEQGYNPFSTQHSVKGAEYDDVFIVLENGNWAQYNFKCLFEDSGTQSVVDRTRKMFYVCCSRAKDNLVVYFPSPSPGVLNKAIEWFGEANVVELEK